jgi:hypothetical protein
MAQGIIQKMSNDHTRGVGNGFIRPTTATGATLVGQDLFFNTTQVVSLGEDSAPLGVGDVVEYTYTAPVNRGVGTAPGRPVAVDIERIERAPQGDERGRAASEATRATGGGQAAGPSVEEQLRATGIYAAI